MKKKTRTPRNPDFLLFNDLSVDLDHRLDWHALICEAIHEELFGDRNVSTEFAAVLFEYLGKRTALEHVFFGRSLRTARLEKTKLAAEIWRYRKIQARSLLNARGGSR